MIALNKIATEGFQTFHFEGRKFKAWIAAGLLLLFFFPANAQFSLLQQANERMRQWDYTSAIDLFEQILKNGDNPEARTNLVECYRRVNDWKRAEIHYAELVKLPKPKPLHFLYFGMALQYNGRCDKAQPWFELYAAEAPYDQRGKDLAKGCEQKNALEKRGQAIYTIYHLPINSPFNDYAPVLTNDKLVFSSERIESGPIQQKMMWNGAAPTRLYQTPLDNFSSPAHYNFSLPKRLFDKPVAKYHEAAATFSKDGKTAYLTCNNAEEGQEIRTEEGLVTVGIYSLKPEEPESLKRLNLTAPQFSMAHPCLSADGRLLFFASNMSGGYGGMDLYVSELEDNRWGLPMNLGPRVNSEGNEVYPFVDATGRLYFASNGRAGLGGLDVFYALATGKGQWTEAVNLGAPVNSRFDDFAFICSDDQTWGFFSSNREGGKGGDDIYAFTRRAATAEILVSDSRTRRPLPHVTLEFYGDYANSLITGDDGRAILDIPVDSCYWFSAAKAGYELLSGQKACADASSPGNVISIPVSLKKEENFVLQGLIFDMMDGLPADSARILLFSDCTPGYADTLFTGPDGRYKFKLKRNCCYTVKAKRRGYITAVSERECAADPSGSATYSVNLNLQPFRDDEGFVVASGVDREQPHTAGTPSGYHFNELSGLYETPSGDPADADLPGGLKLRGGILFDQGEPVMPAKNTWQRDRDGEGYLVNLYYDIDQVSIRRESMAELEKLRSMLLENAGLVVEIASHTDAQGPTEYNLRLSQQRADAIVDWLSQNGIARTRLRARGYGESRLVNQCSDGIPCSESEHALNRRTEFRVLEGVTLRE